MNRQPRIEDYIFTFLQRPDVADHLLFTTFSMHPKPTMMGWSIEAKVRVPMPEEFEEFLYNLKPFRKIKDPRDGCWVLNWKGYNQN